MKSLVRPALAAGLILVSSRLCALPDTEAEAGRAVLKRYADAVIGVELVVTIKGTVGDRTLPQREVKRETNGTVISADGLTVIALSSIDPRMGLNMPNARIDEPEFKETKLRGADNVEIPARVVLKDADLDLAFIAPEEKVAGRKFTFVNLDAATEAQILGTYFDIARGPKVQQRTPAIRVINVTGLIEKPRRFILASDYSPGCPTFDAKDHVLGIAVRHLVNGQPTGNVILPAADVAEIAKQAVAAAAAPKPAVEASPKPASEGTAPEPKSN
jgi:hypothetical protein